MFTVVVRGVNSLRSFESSSLCLDSSGFPCVGAALFFGAGLAGYGAAAR